MKRKLVITLCAVLLAAIPSFAQTSPFLLTYQGQLKSEGTPLSGACDFQFRLFDSPSSGTQISTTQIFEGPQSIPVNSGLFTAALDFGSAAFADSLPRYLEIAVRCPVGFGSYTVLNNRQALTAAPYALSVKKTLTTKYLSIPPAAFNPTSDIPFVKSFQQVSRTTGAGTLLTQFFAPVQLPDGAAINQVVFDVVDNDTAVGATCYLFNNTAEGIPGIFLASTSTAPAFASPNPTSLGVAVSPAVVVDNANRHYTVGCEWNYSGTFNPLSIAIRRARIRYQILEP